MRRGEGRRAHHKNAEHIEWQYNSNISINTSQPTLQSNDHHHSRTNTYEHGMLVRMTVTITAKLFMERRTSNMNGKFWRERWTTYYVEGTFFRMLHKARDVSKDKNNGKEGKEMETKVFKTGISLARCGLLRMLFHLYSHAVGLIWLLYFDIDQH